MSLFSWPTTKFPAPTTSLRGKQESQVARTQMDSGTFRQRERFTSGMQTIDVEWQLTADQWALFQGVKKYKIANGADWFEIPLSINGASPVTYQARFIGDVSWEYLNFNEYKVSAQLETPTISPLTEAEVDAALA